MGSFTTSGRARAGRPLDRRAFLARVGVGGLAAALATTAVRPTAAGAATWRKRLTGADLDTNHRWHVAGTDLGIPYVLENGSIGYLFGDTFDTPWPEGPPLPNDWPQSTTRSAPIPRLLSQSSAPEASA